MGSVLILTCCAMHLLFLLVVGYRFEDFDRIGERFDVVRRNLGLRIEVGDGFSLSMLARMGIVL